ncbi:MAG: polysulfide reductase NrfD [Bacteroidia bacterium]|nr:polysulfide reductase NrfD [Bacteroidia bacterium]
MREEIIVSGRMNKGVDPILHAWGWEIALYLFLGGLAAGLIIYTAFYAITKKENKYFTATKVTPIFASIFLILGLSALFIDLHHKLYFWQLYTNINLRSPMSWGAWTLLIVTPLIMIYSVLNFKELFPKVNFTKYKLLKLIISPIDSDTINWQWKYSLIRKFELFLQKNIRILLWVLLILGIILGIYTGILLSAFNARPLWNTSVLGVLFLTSGLSTAAAFIMLLSKNKEEIKWFSKIDLIMIAIELFLIIHMFMGFLASTKVQIEAANLFLGGQYTVVFWVFVVFIGLILPAILEIMELKGKHINHKISAILVLFGGLLLRFIIIYAGQNSRYLY